MVDFDASSVALRTGSMLVLFLLTMFFGFLPLAVNKLIKKERLRDRLLSLGNSFSGGLFMGAGFVHLLAEANHSLEDEEAWYSENPYAFILAPIGFFLAFAIEKVILLRDPPVEINNGNEDIDQPSKDVAVSFAHQDRSTDPSAPIMAHHQPSSLSSSSTTIRDVTHLDFAKDVSEEEHTADKPPSSPTAAAQLNNDEDAHFRDSDHDEHDEFFHQKDHDGGVEFTHSTMMGAKDDSLMEVPLSADESYQKEPNHRDGIDPSSEVEVLDGATAHSAKMDLDQHDPDQHYSILLDNRHSTLLPYFLAIILSFHSMVAGAAIGIQKDYDSMLPLIIAMVGHKWIESIALGISLARAKTSLRFFAIVTTIYSCMVPIGIVFGTVLSLIVTGSAYFLVEGCLTAVGAGTFIYVAVVDILAEEFESARDKYLKFALVLLGYFGISALIFAFPHEDED